MPDLPISRRRFLAAAAASAATAATAGRVLAAPAVHTGRAGDKPNILLLWTDQQRFDTLAAYGNRFIKAPNLNRLAAEGVTFERHYVAQPVCTPSRGALMTGLHPHQHGCVNNNIALGPETKCLPELVGDADYRTAYFGKWHLGDEIFAQHGFQEWAGTEDGYERWYGPDRPAGSKSAYYHWLKEKGYTPDVKEWDFFSRKLCTTLPIEHCKPSFVAERACDFLQRTKGDPFILSCNYLEPHNPFNGPLNDLHDPAGVPLSANVSDDLDENDPLRYRLGAKGAARQRENNFEALRKTFAIYLGMIAQVDRSVGAILRTLEETGQADRTIVVFTSDHGEMMGSHGMGGKSVMFEEASRVPLLMKIPGVRGGTKVAAPVSNVDVAPTLLALLGRKPPVELPGRDLAPLIDGKSAAGDDHVYIEWNPSPSDEPMPTDEATRARRASERAVVSPEGWKLSLSDVDKGQLYNLKADPGETTNLFASGEHRAVRDRLAKCIRRWQQRTGDKLTV